jgi:uncharacterized protein (UPF0335 family)
MTEGLGDNAISMLRDYVERIEGMEAEKKELSSAISAEKKVIKAELGIEPSLLNKVLKIRAMDPEKRSYEENQIALMLGALGEKDEVT